METLAENTFKKLSELAYALTGINVSSEKKGLIEHKLRKVLREYQLSSFEELYEKMIADGDKYLVQTFIDRVSTNFTYFFRDRIMITFEYGPQDVHRVRNLIL